MKKYNVEFLEESHQYIVNGICVPSVSELIKFKFPNMYEGIPKNILQSKAKYGTGLHKCVEDVFLNKTTLEEINKKKIDPYVKMSVEQAEQLRKKWCLYIKDTEQIVNYKDKYCGTYDLRTDEDFLIDIKTTVDIHIDWLEYQLGLYYLALGIEKPYGYVLHLPKGKMGKVVQINVKSFDECKELVKEYAKHNSN